MWERALFWFSFSLPFSGLNLLLSRTFFSLQRPWIPTALSLGSLVVNAAVSLALYKPYGVAGLVLGTVVSNIAMAAGQAWGVRRLLHGSLEEKETIFSFSRVLFASAILGATAWFVWWGLDDALGRSLPAQIVSVGTAIATGSAFYVAAILHWRVPEGQQSYTMVNSRLAGRRRKPKRRVPPPRRRPPARRR